MKNYFKNLKVIELSSVLAGPAVGMFFAELGAEVIKVENPGTGGDVTRRWKLPEEDPDMDTSAYFFSINWGKEHRFLDLRNEEDYGQLMGLVAGADVILTNFKSGAAEKLKLDYPTLSALNPKLIYASITAYGKDDPRPGFDVALQAETGWIYMTGEKGGNPCKLPVALIDLLAAHQLKEGILVALLERNRTGKGTEVTVSLFDAAIASLANQASNWLNVGKIPQRMGTLHPNIAPYGEIFYTRDGKAMLISTGTAAHFQRLCECLGLSDLQQDSRFSTNPLRLQNRAELGAILEAAFGRHRFADLYDRFVAEGVPVGPVRNLKEVFELPAAQALILEEEEADGTLSRRVRTVIFKIG